MSVDDFLRDAPPLSKEETERLMKGFGDTLGYWVEVWGNNNNVPKDNRLIAFMTAVDIGYRIAKRDIETDKWNKLIS